MGIERRVIPHLLSSKSYRSADSQVTFIDIFTSISRDPRTSMRCVAIQETSGKTLLKTGLNYRVSVPIRVFISSTPELSWKSANYRTPLPTGSLLGSSSMGANVVREGKKRFWGNELAPSCLLGVPVTMATVLHSIQHPCML